MDDAVAKALHAVRHHLAGGGFLSDLFSGPDYLSTGEVASFANMPTQDETNADFFKADRALRLAQQASEPARDMPLPPRRPAPEAAPRQQVAAPPPAPAVRRIETLPGDTVEPHYFPPALERTVGPYDFGQAVSGQQVTTQMLPHFRESPGFGQVLLDNKTNWADAQPEVPTSNPQKYTLPEAAFALPAPQAEISRAVSLAQNLAPAQPEAIPNAADALAAVENLHNSGVYSGEALDKAGEILAAHNRAKFDNIPVEEALRLIRAEGPRMVNQGMPVTGGTTRDIVPLSYAETPAPAQASQAISEVMPAGGKMTARIPEEPHGTALTKQQADYVIRTIAAETSGKSPEETQAIASVILNRINSGKYGSSPEAVLFAKRQFEPWMNPAGANYPMKISPTSQRYLDARAALEAAMAGEDITRGATNFWGPKSQYSLGRDTPDWATKMPDYTDIGATRFHRPNKRAEGGLVDDALHVLRERHADGEAVGQAPVATDNSERARAAESAANLARQIQAYEASMANIRQQPQDIQSMTHAPEKPRAPISVEALGKNREFGSAPYDVAGPLSSFAQGAYDMKTLPLYMYPPTAPLGMAIDTAEGVASGSPTQVAMGALGGPLKVARNVVAPLAVATGVTAPDEAEAGSLERAMRMIRAYHGSPHKFDRFDMSKIGTGEGAQAYGHGLYFAEHEPTAKFYRDSTRPNLPQVFIDNESTGKAIQEVDQTLKNMLLSGKAPEEYYASLVNSPRAEGIKKKLATASREDNGLGFSDYDMAAMEHEGFQKTLNEARKYFGKDIRAYVPEGHMYEVDINANPERLLDWDKPFAAQSNRVRDALQDLGQSPTWRGSSSGAFGDLIYSDIVKRMEMNRDALKPKYGEEALFAKPTELARRELLERGIPGIKYLDAGSRGNNRWEVIHPRGGINDFADEASALAFLAKNPEHSLKPPKVNHNYVIFDDKLIDINRRYAQGGDVEPASVEDRALMLVSRQA